MGTLWSACLGILFYFLFFNTAFAAELTDTQKILRDLGTLLSVIIRFITFILLLIMSWGGELFGTEFVTSDRALEGIRPMWMFIRNITNVGFVLVLLYIAFANLFSFGEGSWGVKQKLPGVIIGLVAINFSLLGVRVLVDAVNVGTVAVLSLADKAVQEKGSPNIKELLEHQIDETGSSCGKDGDGKGKNCKAFSEWINSTVCEKGIHSEECFFRIETADIVDETPATRNIMLSFAVHVMHIEKLPVLAGETGSITNLIDSTLFSFVMALAYAVVIIAVFLVLVMRMVVLWIVMVFSPLIVASMILGLNFASQNSDKFISTLLVPIKVAAAFAVSFIMVSVLIDYQPSSAIHFLEPGAALKHFQNIEGGNMFTMLWRLATLVVFWQAAMWAIEGAEGAEIGKKVMDGAKGAGTFLAKAATIDREIFRLPGTKEDVSLTGLSRLPDMARSLRRKDLQDQHSDMLGAFKDMGGPFAKLASASGDIDKFTNSLENLVEESSRITAKSAGEKLKSMDGINTQGELNPTQVKHFNALFSKYGNKDNASNLVSQVSSAKKNGDWVKYGKLIDEGLGLSGLSRVFGNDFKPSSISLDNQTHDNKESGDSTFGDAKIHANPNKAKKALFLNTDGSVVDDSSLINSVADLNISINDAKNFQKSENESGRKKLINLSIEAIEKDSEKSLSSEERTTITSAIEKGIKLLAESEKPETEE